MLVPQAAFLLVPILEDSSGPGALFDFHTPREMGIHCAGCTVLARGELCRAQTSSTPAALTPGLLGSLATAVPRGHLSRAVAGTSDRRLVGHLAQRRNRVWSSILRGSLAFSSLCPFCGQENQL